MRKHLILSAILLCAACNGADDTPAPGSGTDPGTEANEEAMPDPELTQPPEMLDETAAQEGPVLTLDGAWRVAGIDGEPVDGPQGIALEANSAEIWWPPRCARMARVYTIDGADFTAGDPEAEAPVCEARIPEGLAGVLTALDAGETITRTPENGVLITGGDHSLTLFSQ